MNKTIEELKSIALDIRRDIIEMMWQTGSGHIGGSLSCVEILIVLYFHIMNIEPANPLREERDRFVMSKGHSAAALYAVLVRRGYLKKELLFNSFIRAGGILQEHPDMRKVPGIDMSTGSLGQGLSVGAGMAWAGKYKKKDNRVYVLMGCGEIQEGQIWEAAMSASHLKLDNLIGIIDYNRVQVNGPIDKLMNVEPLSSKWEAFGWEVKKVDGHNISEIIDAIKLIKDSKGSPKVIIAYTVKGKSISFMEGKYEFHAATLTKEEYELAIKELERIK